jgi:hypothetical protein
MATQALVDRQIGDGARLLAALDAAGLEIPVAFWEYRSEWDEWRLVITAPEIDEIGRLAMYAKIQDALRAQPSVSRLFDRVSLVRPDDSRVQGIQTTYHVANDSEGVWLGRTAVGRVFFEDAYLYRAR